MSCNHKPVFKFKQLFARNPENECKKCGAKIQLTSPFRTGLKVANALIIMIILYRAFSNNDTDASLETFFINMAILFGMVLVYLLVIVLIVKYGPYEEVYEEPEEIGEEETIAQASQDGGSKTDAAADSAEDSQESLGENKEDSAEYTEEQKQLIEMYAAYERMAEKKQEDDAEKSTEPAKPLPELQECKHEPVPSWKNYIPSKMDFVCKNCGEQITFSAQRKKSMNLMFLAVMAIILFPNFMNENINFWQYLLITLGALAVATVMQVYFVKRWPMELKNTQ